MAIPYPKPSEKYFFRRPKAFAVCGTDSPAARFMLDWKHEPFRQNHLANGGVSSSHDCSNAMVSNTGNPITPVKLPCKDSTNTPPKP